MAVVTEGEIPGAEVAQGLLGQYSSKGKFQDI